MFILKITHLFGLLTSAFGLEHRVLHYDFSLMYIAYFDPCDYNKEVIKTDTSYIFIIIPHLSKF